MSLTVREALSMSIFKDAKVVAGEGGLDNPIRWTHILDHPEVAEWVKGGEVLLTSGLGIYGDPEAQVKYMREAAEKKVAAVFIAVQEYMPQTTPVMRQVADEASLPLVELPRATPFVEVTEAILRRLATRSIDAGRDYLIQALLAGNLPGGEQTLARLRALGLDADRPHTVVLAQMANAGFEQSLNEEESRALIGALNRHPRRSLVAAMGSWVLAISPLNVHESSAMFTALLQDALRSHDHIDMRVGIGRPVLKIQDFPISYRDAQEALFIAGLTGRRHAVKHFDDLGVWRLLLRVRDEAELEQFATRYLNVVAEHDREQATQWLKTLETFLEQNGNLRATARTLDLHRNTVAYQIDHISQLLGQDLDDSETRLNLQMALRAHLLLKARENQ